MAENTAVWQPAPGVHIPLDALAEFTRVCVKNSEYDFVSGGHGRDYVDLDELFATPPSDHEQLKKVVDAAIERVRQLCEAEGYNALAFIDSRRGPVGILSARLLMSDATGVRSMIVRPYKRLLSQAAKPFGLPADAQVLIVADVATTGRSISDAADVLWKLGARGCGALAIADRQEGAGEFLASLDIPLYAVVVPPTQQAA